MVNDMPDGNHHQTLFAAITETVLTKQKVNLNNRD